MYHGSTKAGDVAGDVVQLGCSPCPECGCNSLWMPWMSSHLQRRVNVVCDTLGDGGMLLALVLWLLCL